MLANILCQHTPLTPGVRSKDHFFFSEITHLIGATRIQPRKNCDHYLHFTVAVLGKFDILFFSLECSGFSKSKHDISFK